MKPRKKRGRKNPGHFKRGHDPRRRVGFTKEECKRGYLAALAKAQKAGWDRLAWVLRLIRGYYRERKRNGSQEDDGCSVGERDDRGPARDDDVTRGRVA